MSSARIIALLLLVFAVSACSDAGPAVHADPGVVRIDSRNDGFTLELHNRGTADARLSNIRFEEEDWTAFSIRNEDNPDVIPAGDTVALDVGVARRRFMRDAHEHGYAEYRSGHAVLALEVDGEGLSIPVEFSAPPGPGSRVVWGLLSGLLLGVGLLGARWIRRRMSGATPAPTAMPTRGHSLDVGSRVLSALGLALAFAVIPIGDAVCTDAFGSIARAGDLSQCRLGRGGAPLVAAPVGAGLLVWWAGIVGFLAAHTARQVGLRPQRESFDRILGYCTLVMTLIAVSVGQASLDPHAWVVGQSSGLDFGTLRLATWGVLTQPVGFVLALMAARRIGRIGGPRHFVGEHGLIAATLVTAFLGGWTLPVLLPFGHGASILLGLVAFALKVAVVSWLLDWRAAGGEQRSLPSDRSVGWPTLLALALLNLAATAAWTAW